MPVLDLAVRLPHLLRDEEREEVAPAPQAGTLRSEVQALVEALGQPRIAALRPDTVVPWTQRAAVRAESWNQLRLLRIARHGATDQDMTPIPVGQGNSTRQVQGLAP
ncbi:hypothetical protein Dgeo_2943 (plasmid) [Deinococcus geothermalis DSM 11300]|uniref:Uncharacterized protein n=1 Tax=Deinococcus geothermalis (strain DSM 11300 / CIP 105573 / AG-3a) TaxID=319795 RepID=A8ZR77_DEIGD|nr:hypothetical protein [Deinococcus geothermalis]ABW34986.1 hypothetical protein Dgeo_2943 [Deinococcus geothermalis DSM 11300]